MRKYTTAIFVTGISLLVGGLIFKIFNWPDSFYGLYTGPFVIMLGIISLVTSYKVKSKEMKPRTPLSSKLTFAYKFFFFPTWCLLVVGMFGFAFCQIPDWKEGLPVVGFGVFMIVVAWLMIRKVRQISFDEKYLYVKNFRSEQKFDLQTVRSMNEGNFFSLDPFFEIEFYPMKGTIKKVDFIPSISELFEYSLSGRVTGNILLFKRQVHSAAANKAHMH